MANINMRIDDELKKESADILNALGLDLTSGIKLFLKQVTIKNGIPFEVTLNKPDILKALEEIQNGDVETFDSFEDWKASMSDED